MLCGATPPRHPDRQLIRTHHLRWARKTGLCPVAVAQKLRLWDLWTDCAVDLDPAIASIIPDYCLMYTVMDDAAETFFESAPIEVPSAALSDFVAVLDGRPAAGGIATRFPRYRPIVRALADLRARILPLGRPELYAEFVAGVDRYRRGVIQQVHMSRHGLVVSRETQIYNRFLNVAFDPTVVLLCLLKGVDLGIGGNENPMTERLHMAICRVGGVINDIISFPKEAESPNLGQYHNLVAAHFNEMRRIPEIDNPLRVSIARTFDFHNNELRDFVEIGSHCVALRPEMGAYVQLGLDMHRSWMNWCLSSDRYREAIRSAQSVRAERPVRWVLSKADALV